MAFSVGVCTASCRDLAERCKFSRYDNLSSRSGIAWRNVSRRKRNCLASEVRGLGSHDSAGLTSLEDDDFSHAIKFSMSDFNLHDRVSIGLGDRADEIIYEATVKEVSSPLYNARVVLRRLLTNQAKRRGRRAIEVLKRLANRRLMYLSYSMQVHGFVCSSTTDDPDSFTLVHGYHGSSSLRHWLQQSDWLPTLEATLALDEESVRRVGDDRVGGSAVSRQLRLIRILMRDLLIGVNYLHTHGLAHTELRLENLHICPVDKHIKVGILGNAADFHDYSQKDSNTDRRRMMIAFDMRCVGYIVAKMVLRDLMNPETFAKFKAFLSKGNDPSCLRDFLMRMVERKSSSENKGFQILDRNCGAGWHLLSMLLATRPSRRVSCFDALRHPFLCGPKWRVNPTMDMIRWSLGSTAVRISEEYIYAHQQRRRIAHFIELMEMLNPHPRPRSWLSMLPGKWRLLYSTGRHVGLTLRQPRTRVLIGDVYLKITNLSKPHATFSIESQIGFTVMLGKNWPHDKSGTGGRLAVSCPSKLRAGRRLYIRDDDDDDGGTAASAGRLRYSSTPDVRNSIMEKLSSKKWRRIVPEEKKLPPDSLPVSKLLAASSDVEIVMSIDGPLGSDVGTARDVVREVRVLIPPEMFDPSKIVCGTWVDSRLLVLRSVNGSALLFTRAHSLM